MIIIIQIAGFVTILAIIQHCRMVEVVVAPSGADDQDTRALPHAGEALPLDQPDALAPAMSGWKETP